MPQRWKEIVRLKFCGPRFEGHAIDVPALAEIVRYQELLKTVAKATYRKENPEAGRLPNRFDEMLALRFSRIEDGSTVIPLEAPEEYDDPALFDVERNGMPAQAAAFLIRDCVAAAVAGEALPERFPRTCLVPLTELGRGLGAENTVRMAVPGEPAFVSYGQAARDRLTDALSSPYEDMVRLVGKVLQADVKSLRFVLYPPSGTGVQVLFEEAQEDVVIRALKEHRSQVLQVEGTGEYGADGQLKRIKGISSLFLERDEMASDAERTPIWAKIEALGQEIPQEDLGSIPTDMSSRIDEYLYGERSA